MKAMTSAEHIQAERARSVIRGHRWRVAVEEQGDGRWAVWAVQQGQHGAVNASSPSHLVALVTAAALVEHRVVYGELPPLAAA